MGRRRCIVVNCDNEGKRTFPKCEYRRKQWIDAIKYTKHPVTQYSRICSAHFRLSDFSMVPTYWNNYYSSRALKKDAIPSVFPWNIESKLQELPEETLSLEQPPSPEPDSDTDTFFNPLQVKATYSRGQKSKPNTLKINKLKRLKVIKKPPIKNIPFASNIGGIRTPISKTGIPIQLQIKSKIPLNQGEKRLPPTVAEKDTGALTSYSPSIEDLTSSPPVVIKSEPGIEPDNNFLNSSQTEDVKQADRAWRYSMIEFEDDNCFKLPPVIKDEKEENTMIEIEIDILKPIKKEVT